MNDLIAVTQNENMEPVVSGRELHRFLEINERYNDWIHRMLDYGFIENVDYMSFTEKTVKPKGGRPMKDHVLKLDMAKELSMLARNEKGKVARKYFIEIEKEYNSPDKVMARALMIANNVIAELKPKAEYFDELVDRNLLTNFRDTAKELGIKEKVFINELMARGYIYRDKKRKLKPYAEKNKGLFELKEYVNERNGHTGTQTLITPKGRETFRLLLQKQIA
ncbi:MAG: phage antirepressor KilAC domain-containing protein [Miniphocaeibacter sp.]|uniref:phage antirepressor KilAC domain-containing protein n=1 Tax=Miniphocaeibacter sp. TaxID=3100973 RepID=UPI0017AE5615|nr:oxidoreductase [Gallicola sp.]